MASGYTAIIEEKDDVSLNEFVWRVAHGWCYDLGLNERIEFKTKKDNYYSKRLEETEKEIKELSDFTEDQKKEWSRQRIQKTTDYYQKTIEEKNLLRDKYNKMLEKVQNWQIPTEDHSKLKSYMIEQIEQSIDYDCDISYYQDYLNSLSNELEYFNSYYENLLSDKDHLRQKIQEEDKEFQKRYEWFLAIENSVGPEPDYK